MSVRRLEQAAIVVLALAVAGQGRSAAAAIIAASGLTLLWWRTRPRLAATAGGGVLVAVAMSGGAGVPDSALAVMTLLATVTALGWSGRGAWVAGGGLVAYLFGLWLIVGGSPVALAMFSLPGFAAGTAFRLRREAADELARRGRELEEERELFAALSMRHERARIAAELHDIIGHAISVMIIQAAAGQRLVGKDPDGARSAFTAIAESARQGQDDLRRLIDLLGGGDIGTADLSLIEEVVTRAARSGLDVSCRFEGDRDGVTGSTAHIAFRVVQESLTNALRYAPGAAVRVRVGGQARTLTVGVRNDQPAGERPAMPGTGRGLIGLRERVQERGGRLVAGPTATGGWAVRAMLPK